MKQIFYHVKCNDPALRDPEAGVSAVGNEVVVAATMAVNEQRWRLWQLPPLFSLS